MLVNFFLGAIRPFSEKFNENKVWVSLLGMVAGNLGSTKYETDTVA
jgi:hypothetical protein